jgi:hypothetical protein
MTADEIWDSLKGIGKKAWGAVGATSAFITLLAALFYKDILKDADIPPLVKDLTPLITLVVCFFLFTAVMFASRLLSAWAEKKGHVHVDARETVTYHAHAYKPGSDLLRLSEYAHRVFKGDTMKAEIVQMAVKNKAATGLRLTDPEGRNIGFLDVFHFTDMALEQWKNGDLPEDALREEHFRKIPARGEDLNLAMGAIYVKPDADRGVAHQFANIGELFLRKSFPKFHRINLYATIFAPDGERIAKLYKFEISKKAKDRTGPYAHGHDLRLRVIDLDALPHSIGGVGGSKHVVIEVVH